MRIKYKKLRLIIVTAIMLTSSLPLVTSATVTPLVSAAPTCIADNSDLCGSSCTKDSNGNDVDCYQADPANTTGGACNKQQCDLVGKYINPAIQLLSLVVGIVAVISLIFAGIQYTTSEGNPQNVSKARMRIVNTVIGLLAYAFLFGLLQFLVPGGLFNRS